MNEDRWVSISEDQLARLLDLIESQGPGLGTPYLKELKELSWQLGMVPLIELQQASEHLVGELAQNLGKQVQLKSEGFFGTIRLSHQDALKTALLHGLRNAIDHGIDKQGTVSLTIEMVGAEMVLAIQSEGRPFDRKRVLDHALFLGLVDVASLGQLTESQILELLFHPGFSTRVAPSQWSGRGVGLDALRAEFEKLSGRSWLQINPKQNGLTLFVSVPLKAYGCEVVPILQEGLWHWVRLEVSRSSSPVQRDFRLFRPMPKVWQQAAPSWLKPLLEKSPKGLLITQPPLEAQGKQPFSVLLS